jgi:NADH-quinone oxidoreductase subunit L
VTREFPTGAEAGHGAPATEAAAHAPAAASGHGATPYGDVGFNLAHSIETTLHSQLGTEWLFIVLSLIAAGIGIGLGLLFYLRDPRLPDIWANRLRPLYNASYNKYWVDEFYGLAITRRTMDLARGVFAFDSKLVDGIVNGLATLSHVFSRIVGGIDKYLVDGLVNTIAAFIARLMSPLFRAAQTGFAQNYALVMVLGLMVGVIAFFGSDVASAVANALGVIKNFFGFLF